MRTHEREIEMWVELFLSYDEHLDWLTLCMSANALA
jgi:hypothetical protein